MMNLFFKDCNSSRTILEDFLRDNEEKEKIVIDSIIQGSKVIGIFGDRGSGKTSLATTILSHIAKHTNREIWYYGSFIAPKFANKTFDLSEIPNNSIIYCDELGILFPSRDSASSSSKALTTKLVGLRHFGHTIIGGSQKGALIDINLIRFLDIMIFKYMNLYSLNFERESFITPLIEMMLPEYLDKSCALFVEGEQFIKFNYNVTDEFSEEISHNLALISEKDKMDYIHFEYEQGTSINEIKRIMQTKFGFNKTLNFYKALLEG